MAGSLAWWSKTARPRHAPRPPTTRRPPPSTPEERIEHLEAEVKELKAKATTPSFYRGIPSSEVIKALDDLGFGELAKLDEVPPSGWSVHFPTG
ncbi:hypothetical protein MINTM008_23340 [Mycobacterium intracellulare]|nr:hypothetical protein [Mycobacterium intracellulare]BCO67488.1 hypothetical protein MINTM007_20990 [Mycobacterium intracellulare]BCO72999.1 hypothetical protein MINTM008_23340 [Mycobacterium intracellulare]BCO78447.1 hypothetical protein MINTM009_22290 [Mycobacterium intracellulare]BCP31419.1 hypothetical protein MINTM026_23890 [Mycobacterium intracellulare]BCP42364.1 hypothetical protein MINTMi27_24570 [Mycobacterium intracellulare]